MANFLNSRNNNSGPAPLLPRRISHVLGQVSSSRRTPHASVSIGINSAIGVVTKPFTSVINGMARISRSGLGLQTRVRVFNQLASTRINFSRVSSIRWSECFW